MYEERKNSRIFFQHATESFHSLLSFIAFEIGMTFILRATLLLAQMNESVL